MFVAVAVAVVAVAIPIAAVVGPVARDEWFAERRADAVNVDQCALRPVLRVFLHPSLSPTALEVGEDVGSVVGDEMGARVHWWSRAEGADVCIGIGNVAGGDCASGWVEVGGGGEVKALVGDGVAQLRRARGVWLPEDWSCVLAVLFDGMVDDAVVQDAFRVVEEANAWARNLDGVRMRFPIAWHTSTPYPTNESDFISSVLSSTTWHSRVPPEATGCVAALWQSNTSTTTFSHTSFGSLTPFSTSHPPSTPHLRSSLISTLLRRAGLNPSPTTAAQTSLSASLLRSLSRASADREACLQSLASSSPPPPAVPLDQLAAVAACLLPPLLAPFLLLLRRSRPTTPSSSSSS
jgi:hypothetical protein